MVAFCRRTGSLLIGVSGGRGAVRRFARDERLAVSDLRFGHPAWCWFLAYEKNFIPYNRWQVVRTDHHDVVQIDCANETRVRGLVGQMEAVGHTLPTEPLDWTIKRPV